MHCYFRLSHSSGSCRPLVAQVFSEQHSTLNPSDQVDVVALVLGSEAKANGWAKSERICFSIEDKDPSNRLIKALRQRGLNTAKDSSWSKHFDCGFSVRLRFSSFKTDGSATVRAEVSDVRDINNGTAHIAALIRDGQYLMRKTGESWSIADYSAVKPESHR
jgi:hypothetical protein